MTTTAICMLALSPVLLRDLEGEQEGDWGGHLFGRCGSAPYEYRIPPEEECDDWVYAPREHFERLSWARRRDSWAYRFWYERCLDPYEDEGPYGGSPPQFTQEPKGRRVAPVFDVCKG